MLISIALVKSEAGYFTLSSIEEFITEEFPPIPDLPVQEFASAQGRVDGQK